MAVELTIDQAVYLVGDRTRSYRFLRRNLRWQAIDPVENERNTRRMDGYTRLLTNGRAQEFRLPL